MIFAVLYFAAFLCCGILTVRFLFPRFSPLSRVWLGASLGVLEMMWLPALFAFVWDFGIKAHGAALGTLALLTALAFAFRDRRKAASWDEDEQRLMKQMLLVVLPLTVLGGYLQYTHVMRVDEFGNWNVGQSTYGDLPMHLSFITGLKDARFPADYPFFPGNRLSYPFLVDSFSTSFYLLGCSLQLSVILPGTFMMMLCYMGVMLLSREMTAGKRTVVMVALLFFLNGGLGFLYDFDMAGGTEYDGTVTVWTRIRAILEGYYKTPTNQPTPNNLRWSNVIADLMIPQRTLLGGWCMALPCFFMLEKVFRAEKRDVENGLRGEILLGVWAGALPLIHTHSFLALGLYTGGIMIYDLIHGETKGLDNLRAYRNRVSVLLHYLLFGAIVLVLASPQLVCFTFTQTFQGNEAHSFLTVHFNWVNSTGGTGESIFETLLLGIRGMKDLYLWFYIKNIGIPFVILLLTIFEKNRKNRRVLCGALVIILAVELIRFQPNDYDNNKLLYLAWLLCCMPVADWMRDVWHRLKGMGSRPVLAVMAAVVMFLSAGLTLWRECVSSYQAFSKASVEAGEYVRDHTSKEDVFLTGTQHLNPVISIGGRTIVCGPDLWLYWHGFDTSERKGDIARFLRAPGENSDVLEKYGVEYIYISSYERNEFEVNDNELKELYEVVFSNREATIYRIWPG